ncbi:hypothetical protein K432DRAFT_397953 [Lepidopterella palustris CBS 459.81]|uniref:Uncharacterized protein n=1 Tax=Lepidopterella palustris CBS 459.81 TaxID=1314670 RepID=A0A8E2DZV1_9PEZI|nr:hypothetical protein K432DRAFT_397953 [Lepidopterella palustris CBS 459.81]
MDGNPVAPNTNANGEMLLAKILTEDFARARNGHLPHQLRGRNAHDRSRTRRSAIWYRGTIQMYDEDARDNPVVLPPGKIIRFGIISGTGEMEMVVYACSQSYGVKQEQVGPCPGVELPHQPPSRTGPNVSKINIVYDEGVDLSLVFTIGPVTT